MTRIECHIIAAPCGAKLMLVDQHGVPLPNQRETVLRCGIDGPDEVTVTFVIDGEDVRLATD